jgi:hypothetical protein
MLEVRRDLALEQRLLSGLDDAGEHQRRTRRQRGTEPMQRAARQSICPPQSAQWIILHQ